MAIDITPTYTLIPSSELIIASTDSFGTTIGGMSVSASSLSQGSGDDSFTLNSEGLFLGSAEFATAPFSVDMQGKLTASSLTIAGDIESSNYTEITPYTGYKLEYLTGKLYANDVVIRGGTIGGQAVTNVGYASDSTALTSPNGLTISTTGTTTAEDGTISSYSTITWEEITGNTFREYKVRYKKSAFTYYQYISTTSNTLTIDGLTPNTSYDFAIASVNKYGIESSYSSTVTSTTATSTTPPAKVQNVTALGGIQQVIVEWNSNIEADLSSYNVYRNTVNNSVTATLISNIKSNYLVDGGRTGGQIYYYWIKAVNTSGLESVNFSTVTSATPRNVGSADNQISNIGWVQDCIFSSSNHNTVTWTAGTFKTSADTTYNILTGNTGAMSGLTYIYLDISESTTEYQITTTATNAVGESNVLIAVAQNSTDETKSATFQVFGGAGGQQQLVDTAQILKDAITATEISNLAVTNAKIAVDAIYGDVIKAKGITGVKIDDNTIAASNIAANTITAGEIAVGTITTSEIAANTIEASNIASNTITAAEIAASTITTSEIAANTIEANNIKANTITASEIAAATITASEIAANTIEAGNIKAGTITATEIDTTSITSLSNLTLSAPQILIDGTTYLSNWRNSTDLTKIDGGNIYTGSITTTQLNFTPVQNTNVIASINASDEGITIDADNITISGSTTFTSGYDPSEALAAAQSAQSTADGKIVTFYQEEAPTAEGIGDLWIDTNDKNKLYRWSGSEWITVRDTDITQALSDASQAISDASTAQGTADGKVTTFYQSTSPTATAVGDLWIDTDDDRLYRWSGSLWEEIQDTDIAQAISDAQTAQATADGKIVSFYADEAPTASAIGDLWIDTDDNRLYRWNGSLWIEIQDADIAQAISDAGDAKATADGKIVSFYADEAPTATAVGDLWFDTNDNNKQYRWSGSNWIAVPDENKLDLLGGSYDSASSGARVRIFPDANTGIQVIDDATNDVFKCLVGGTDVGDLLIGDYAHDKGMFYDKSASTFTFKGLMDAGSISGVTVTGGTIQTSSTGQRVEIASSNNTLTFYNDDNNIITQLGGGDYIGTALRIDLDGTTTVGSDVRSSQANDIGYQYVSSGNYSSVGTNLQLTGATNTGIGVNINHEGTSGESIYIDTPNGAKGIAISNSGSGESLKILSSAGQSININHTATNFNAIELTSSGSYDALLINSNLGNGKSAIHTNANIGGCAFFESSAADPAVTITHSANTGNPALTINKNGIGNGIYLNKNSRGSAISIDQDDTTNNDLIGLELDIYNGVYPTRALAFNFVGNIRANASSLGSLSGVIRVKHGGSIGYIPVYSSYS